MGKTLHPLEGVHLYSVPRSPNMGCIHGELILLIEEMNKDRAVLPIRVEKMPKIARILHDKKGIVQNLSGG